MPINLTILVTIIVQINYLAIAMVSTTLSSFLLVLVLSFFVSEAQRPALTKGLSWSFYQSSCPQLESIIRNRLQKQIKDDVGQAAGLLRLHFHDCFVQVIIYLYTHITRNKSFFFIAN